MRRMMVTVLGIALVAVLTGCAPNVPNPIGVSPGGLALLLDDQGEYHSIMNKPGRIYLTDKRGSFLRELTGVHSPMGWLRLSPDGRRLLYLAAEEFKEVEGKDYVEVKRWGLRLFDVGMQTESMLAESKEEIVAPSFSPQGDRVAYLLKEAQTPSWKLHILDLITNEEKVVEDERDYEESVRQYVWSYRWSGDGQAILLLRSFTPESEEEAQDEMALLTFFTEIGLYTLEYSYLEPLLHVFFPFPLWLVASSNISYNDLLDWSSDGRKILVVAGAPIFSDDQVHFQLYLIEADEAPPDGVTMAMKLLASDAGSPSFSPQGDKLAFIGTDGPIHLDSDRENPDADQAWIYLGDGSGENLRQIAGPGYFTQLFWVSEEELGYVEEPEDSPVIWIHNLATGERFNLSAALAEQLGTQ